MESIPSMDRSIWVHLGQENSPLLCGVHFNLSFSLFPTLHRGTSGQTNNHSQDTKATHSTRSLTGRLTD